MVQPTRMQLFFASGWPHRLWFAVAPVAVALIFLRDAEATIGMLLHWPSAGWIVLVALLGWVVGVLLAVVFGWPLLGSIYYSRELANGGPFKVGDRVLILRKPHRGRISTVYQMWQCETVRVDVGEDAKAAFTDIFSGAELMAASTASIP